VPASHHTEQIFPGVQYARHFRKTKQAAVALQSVHAPEQLVHHILVVRRVFKMHQLGAGTFKQIAGFAQELFQQGTHGHGTH